MQSKLIVALDTANPQEANRWASATEPYCSIFKVGPQLYYANDFMAYGFIAMGRNIMLDLKLHDIPSVVGSAVRIITTRMAPKMLTLHALGGVSMIKAARVAVDAMTSESKPLLLAVTVLTSLDQAELHELGIFYDISEFVTQLALAAVHAGADGIVCSPREVLVLRKLLPSHIKLVATGIRSYEVATEDQSRTGTAAKAVLDGADYVVVGRPITQASDPGTAAARIASSIL